jgi:hypothetical protein
MRDPIGRKGFAHNQILTILIQHLPSLDAKQADLHVCRTDVDDPLDTVLAMVRCDPFHARFNATVYLLRGYK